MPEATPAGITKVHIVDATGATIPGGGSAVSLADGADVTEGTKADAAWDGLAASATVVSILKKIATSGASAGLTDAQLRATAVPVSLTSTTITGTVDVSDRVGRLLGVVKSITDPVAVTGTFWQVTQPVSIAAAVAVTGPLTDAQLRASAVPVSGPLTDAQLRASAVPVSLASTTITGSVAVTGPLTDTQLRASAVPVSGPLTDTQLRASAVPVSLASTTITGTVDVSDRAARLLGVVDKGKIWDGSNIATVKAGVVAIAGDNPLVVTLHPSSAATAAQPVTGTFFQGTQPVSLAAAVDVSDRAARALGVIASITASVAVTGPLTDTQLRASAVPVSLASTTITGTVAVTPPTLTKGTQGATGFSVQELRDAGRNQTNYFHAAPIITTVAEVMQTLTGYKGGIAVAATATPAVVTAGKTYRISRITINYTAATVIGGALIRLRANLTGVGVVGSPLVETWQVGNNAAFVAGEVSNLVMDYPEGLEFPAGTGIAVGVIGAGAVPTTGTITGYVQISIEGYEY